MKEEALSKHTHIHSHTNTETKMDIIFESMLFNTTKNTHTHRVYTCIHYTCTHSSYLLIINSNLA